MRKLILYVAAVTLVAIGLMCLNFIAVYASVRLDVAWSRTQAFSVIMIMGLVILYSVTIGAVVKQYIRKEMVRYILSGVLIGGAVLIVVLEGAYLGYIETFSRGVIGRAQMYDQRQETINYKKAMKTDTQCPILLPATFITGTQEGLDLLGDESHALNTGVQRHYRLPCPVKTP